MYICDTCNVTFAIDIMYLCDISDVACVYDTCGVMCV